MYNGVGLNTARGSGTAGYVQANKFTVPRKPEAGTTSKKPAPMNQGVGKNKEKDAERDRKREIENKLLVLEEELIDHGYSGDEVREKLVEARRGLERSISSRDSV